MKNQLVSVFFAVIAFVALTSCSNNPFKKSPKNDPYNPPPVAIMPPPVIATPSHPVSPATAMSYPKGYWPNAPWLPSSRSKGLDRIPIQGLQNTIDVDAIPPGSGNNILVTNLWPQRAILQLSDRFVTVQDGGVKGVVVLHTIDAVAIRDPKIGAKMNLRAIILNDADQMIGFIDQEIGWNYSSTVEEQKWFIPNDPNMFYWITPTAIRSGPQLLKTTMPTPASPINTPAVAPTPAPAP